MSIFAKLMNIQAELKAPKGQYNSFGKYPYRNCEDILESLKPHLVKHGATVFLSDEIEVVGDRYYVKATATFVDVETGEKHSVTALAREEESKKGMDGSQVTGASSSYARKYALNGLFAIDDNKDSDTTNNENNTPPQSSAKKTPPKPKEEPKKTTDGLSEKTRAEINLLIVEYKKLTGTPVAAILDNLKQQLGFSVNDVKDESQAAKVSFILKNMINTQKEGSAS